MVTRDERPDIRPTGGIVFLVIATLVGLVCPLAFGVTGLDWTFSKPTSVLDDSPRWDAERLWHVQAGLTSLVM